MKLINLNGKFQAPKLVSCLFVHKIFRKILASGNAKKRNKRSSAHISLNRRSQMGKNMTSIIFRLTFERIVLLKSKNISDPDHTFNSCIFNLRNLKKVEDEQTKFEEN